MSLLGFTFYTTAGTGIFAGIYSVKVTVVTPSSLSVMIPPGWITAFGYRFVSELCQLHFARSRKGKK
jgi:hypothetical protein